MRNLVPAADRRNLQEAVTRPFEDLLDQIASEGHFLAYEEWNSEFADENLTDEDYRRALDPAFDATKATRRLIEVRLDGPALLAFELGELVDQGIRPPCIYRDLRRPRTAPGQPEGEPIWGSVRSGEVAPNLEWYENTRQILIELAVALDLPTDAFALEQTFEDEGTGALVARLVEGVEATLIASHEGRREDISVELPSPIEPRDEPSPPSEELSAILECANAFDPASDASPGNFAARPTSQKLHEEWDPCRISFDGQSWTVRLDGKNYIIEDHFIFNVFRQIYDSTCENKRIKGSQFGTAKLRRRLNRWLPPELNSLIDSRDGNGGGYILRFPRKSP